MRHYLLDTHVLLWWLSDYDKIAQNVRDEIAHPKNRIFVSVASIWEIQLKRKIGKLDFAGITEEIIADNGFYPMEIAAEHALYTYELPLLHHDPFDRMLISQTACEDMILITADKKIMQYDCRILKAQ